MHSYLAYGMAVYALASIYYLLRTRSIGTPFNDSLSEKQKKIKKESSKIRKNIFIQGIVGSIILMVMTKPFNAC
jgi:hypothetical protein